MFKKLYNVVGSLLALKIFFWAEPNAKKFIKGIFIGIILVALIIYSHNEYLDWVELSGNKSHLSNSFLIKNSLIFLTIIIMYFFLKKEKEIKEIKKIEGEEKIYTKEFKEDYFDKFRYENLKKLKSKTDFLLKKNNEQK